MVRKQQDANRFSAVAPTSRAVFHASITTVRQMNVASLLMDEGIVYDPKGMPNFDFIHCKQYDAHASLIATQPKLKGKT
jgi:hypothetical protein